ncbi:hypothetical protein IEO21_05990 [Rhodonia placenta]|uniref:Acyl-coenzyme A oxidase n=1 Tax=Rhodonia placenta TaxID=104341 RepID=A0A8H7U1K4_9APHY|nr:hypothetical protein IEO21_05990 [Postia placenta]
MTKYMTAQEMTKRDMVAARMQTSVQVARVRDYLYGGSEGWKLHEKLVKVISSDAIFDKSQRPFMTRKERYERAIKMTNRLYELQDIHSWSNDETAVALNIIDEELPMHLHFATFEPVFMDQCGPELRHKYGDLIMNRGIQGCYLQTELGHGTNVGSLETTAIYLPETKEFEIHSPTLTSSKWWVGSLGKTSTHGVVQAKLIMPDGRDMGPHLFFVQLRSLEDHTPIPGITLGDIGPKAMGGYCGVDNGFARFDQLRIPRENMLSEYSRVTEDGQYVKPVHPKISYGGVCYIHSELEKGAWVIGKASTVSIRYCTVRRQSNQDNDGLEQQVISYPSVHFRLLPVLSHAYAFILIGRDLKKRLSVFSARLATGDTSTVQEMHIATSMLKILVASMGAQDIETVRRSMGGHGFSEFAALGRYYADWLPVATYEGDNYVLDIQIVRAALKSYRALQASEHPTASSLPPSSAYLRLLLPEFSTITGSTPAWLDPMVSINLLERRVAVMVENRALHEKDPDASMDNRVSRAAAEAYFATKIGALIENLSRSLPPQEVAVGLLALVESGIGNILSFSLLPSADGEDATRGLRMAIKQICAELLPEATGLTDAFGFTDWELDSALGVFDGNVYEQLWAKAQTEPLNATEVTEGYEASIKPMLQRGQRIVASSKAKL